MKKSTLRIVPLFMLVTLFLPVTNVLAVEPALTANTILAYTNAERYKEKVPFLSSNKLLSEVARKKMIDLFAYQYFAHESPSGDSVSDLAREVGYEYIVVGENLALGDFTSSKHVVDSWMNSEGHRKNIMSPSYSEIGIAVGRSMYKGRYTWIAVQSFGFPKAGCPSIDTALQSKIDSFQEKLDIYANIAQIRKDQIERTDGTLEERKTRVSSYNVAARLYNEAVDEYKKLVAEYNEGVGAFNQCLRTTVSAS